MASLKYFNLDYFNFTYFKEDSEDVFQSFLDDFPEFHTLLEDMVILNGKGSHKSWGYGRVLAFTDFIIVRSDDQKPYRGVSVSISARGLETFFSLFNLMGDDSLKVSEVFAILKSRGCRPSRIDLCFDDFSKTYMPEDYQRWFMTDCFNTRMQKNGFFRDANKGCTFYLGSRKKKMLRIYDKEIESKGEIKSVRYEFELHGLNAQAMFDQIISENVPAFGDLILDTFRIVIPDGDKRKDRLKDNEEWISFIKSTLTQNYVKVSHYRRSSDPERFRLWFEKDMVPALKGFINLYGFEWLKLALDYHEPSNKWKRICLDYGLL